MKLIATAIVSAALAGLPLTGFAADHAHSHAHADAHAHVHGKAELNVSVEGDRLVLGFESPLDNLVGFERVPKYEKDLAKVREVAGQLRRTEELFVPTAAAQCKPAHVKLVSTGLDPALLGEQGVKQAADGEHMDMDAEYVFQCANPGALKGVEVKVFDRFKRLRQIDAVVVTPKRQSAAKLTSRARQLAW